ncbi:MAG TPA: hypothetical protein VLM40_00570 [Gemmata sp.]|nr:hypothetical protein [Gemmata sp.]
MTVPEVVVPPAMTTPLPGVLVPPVVDVVPLVEGIGIGTLVPVLGVVITLLAGMVVVIVAPRFSRARRRPNNPRRVVVPLEYTMVGAVDVVTAGVGTGAAAGFGSSADAGMAYRSPTASANRNFFMLLPPETA